VIKNNVYLYTCMIVIPVWSPCDKTELEFALPWLRAEL